MASRNSPNDLRAAVKALTRAKTDTRTEQGGRIIWHRSADAELASWVDGKGRLLKQLLVLFEDAVLWQHGQRMRSGELKNRAGATAPPSPEEVAFDATFDKERHGRAKLGAEPYEGSDKYIMHIARMVSVPAGLAGASVVTRASNDVLQRQQRAMAARARNRTLFIGVGAAAVLLVVFFVLRGH